MSTSPHQLFLLADHIKLSLLERQRAQSLKLPSNNKTDGPITRSLESLRAGLESLTAQAEEQESISGECVFLVSSRPQTLGQETE
jgi:syntaxin 8